LLLKFESYIYTSALKCFSETLASTDESTQKNSVIILTAVITSNLTYKVTQRRQGATDLRAAGRVRLVEEGPDAGFEPLPAGQGAGKVVVFIAEQPGNLLVARFISVNVQFVQYR
jgi:hypothetical protein